MYLIYQKERGNNMLITINDKFQINVPQFTDEINDLKKLYTLNFQDKKLSKRKYTLLDNQIINSCNSYAR